MTSMDTHMHIRDAAPVSGEAGFTLVEVLTALAIFSIVGVAALSLTQRMITARKKVSATNQQLRQLQRARRALSADLRRVERFPLAAFVGDAHSMTLPLVEPGPSGTGRLAAITYFAQADSGGTSQNLLRRQRDFKGHETTAIMFRKLERFNIRYLVAAGDGAEWQTAWHNSMALPAAVLVTLQPEGSERPVKVLYPIHSHSQNAGQKIGS